MDIYLIRNNVTGQFYVGKAVDYKVRFENHKRSASRDTKNSQSISKNMRTYGVHNFTIELLLTCGDDEWQEVEMRLINEHRNKDPSKCLNIIMNSGSRKRPIRELTTGKQFETAAEASIEFGVTKEDIRYSCRSKIGLANLNKNLLERLKGYSFSYTYLTQKEKSKKRDSRKKVP